MYIIRQKWLKLVYIWVNLQAENLYMRLENIRKELYQEGKGKNIKDLGQLKSNLVAICPFLGTIS